MRTWPVLLVALLMAVPAALAGSREAPEVSDPAGDQAVEAGLLVVGGVNQDAFSDVDIVAAWVEEANGTVSITVETTAALTDATALSVSFAVERGPTSYHNSTATGAVFTLNVTGLAASGADGVTGTQNGTLYTFAVPLLSLGATGGDLLANLTVHAARTNGGNFPDPITEDDQAGQDVAPDSGGGAPYTFFRVPVEAAFTLIPQAGEVTVVGGEAEPFTGPTASVPAADAAVSYTVEVRNTGTDPDGFNFTVQSPDAAFRATVTPAAVSLLPGEAAALTVGVEATDAPDGEASLTLAGRSDRGATASLALVLDVQLPAAPAPPAEREPTPAGLGFLTPAAEALGLDDALGEYAELFLLALLVLLAILLVFLLMALTRRPWVKVRLRPKKAKAAPGETAEFHVDVENPKRKERRAKAGIAADADWRSGILLKQGEEALPPLTRETDRLDLVLPGRRDPASRLEGTLRVRVPLDAAPHKHQVVGLDVVPLDEGGAERPAHAGHAKVRVEATAAPSPVESGPVRLDPVTHSPDRPAPGETVESTVRVHNDGDHARRLRVVLSVDGHTEAEETVGLPGRSDETVRLRWEAGPGPNQVRVQVYSA